MRRRCWLFSCFASIASYLATSILIHSAPQFAMLLTLYWHVPIVARRMARDTALKKRFNNYSESVQNRPRSLFNNVPYAR
jgi:hypothetical protein